LRPAVTAMNEYSEIGDPAVAARRRWMGVLAKAPLAALEQAWTTLVDPPAYVMLRAPEIGLCMVRGRAGGTGTRFNLGETTMTRCAVRIASGEVGHGYVAGRSIRHAELAALFDALLQSDKRGRALMETLIEPLVAAKQGVLDASARKIAATKVEFFTMVRGED